MIKKLVGYVEPLLVELRSKEPRWLASHLVMAWMFCSIPVLYMAMDLQELEDKAAREHDTSREKLYGIIGEVVCLPNLLGLVAIRALVGVKNA